MKNTTLTLSVVTVATAGYFALDLAFVKPALAQGARFRFAPNAWAMEEPKKYYYARQYAPPRSCSWEGQVPQAQTLFGFDPSSLPRAYPAHPQMAKVPIAPPTVPPSYSNSYNSVSFNFQIGNPKQPPVMIAQQPAPYTYEEGRTARSPTQGTQNAPNTQAKRNVSARVSSPKRTERTASAGNLAEKIRPPEEKSPVVLGYKDESYSQGPTSPSFYSAGFQTVTKLCGQLLGRKN